MNRPDWANQRTGHPRCAQLIRENLKLLALDAAYPARNVVGVSIRDARDGIVKLGQTSLSLRKLVQLAQRDPALVLAAIAAQDRRQEISHHWA